MKEIWKDVVGYEELYKVSNLGNVKSSERFDSMGRKVNGRIRKLTSDGRGYLMLSLWLNGKQKSRRVHQLVAEAFLNHTPCGNRLVVDHIDNDKSNNKLSNLQVITHRENISKDVAVGTSKYVGVSLDSKKNKYIANIRYNGKQIYLGEFKEELDASEAYNKFLKSIKDNGVR